jgi:hypothetical protein
VNTLATQIKTHLQCRENYTAARSLSVSVQAFWQQPDCSRSDSVFRVVKCSYLQMSHPCGHMTQQMISTPCHQLSLVNATASSSSQTHPGQTTDSVSNPVCMNVWGFNYNFHVGGGGAGVLQQGERSHRMKT